MNLTYTKLIILSLTFLLIFLFGFWLSSMGIPYGSLILTAHKLLAVGAFIYLALQAYNLARVTPLNPMEWAILMITGLLFIATIASGSALATGKAMPAFVSQLHLLLPFLVLASTAVSLTFIIFSRQPA